MSKLILDEMNGPDELRELLIPNTAITSDEVRRRIAVAADAWELDLACHQSFVEHHEATDEHCLDLMKRLEAANRLLDRCMGYLEGDDELRKAVYAALAGEEKP